MYFLPTTWSCIKQVISILTTCINEIEGQQIHYLREDVVMRVMMQWSNCTNWAEPSIEGLELSTSCIAVIWYQNIFLQLPYLLLNAH